MSLILAVALGMGGLFAAALGDVAVSAAARERAQAGADAAALAAAQEMVLPRARSPGEMAEEYARRHGADVVRCRCPTAGSEAVVTVAVEVDLPVFGRRATAHASARAVVSAPAGSRGLQPWFSARLSCLFGRVPGLTIVSGFRTLREQVRLHAVRPDLAAAPGRSQHERGLAADLGFASPSARAAAHREAAPCGLEFPVAHEPWHVEPR